MIGNEITVFSAVIIDHNRSAKLETSALSHFWCGSDLKI